MTIVLGDHDFRQLCDTRWSFLEIDHDFVDMFVKDPPYEPWVFVQMSTAEGDYQLRRYFSCASRLHESFQAAVAIDAKTWKGTKFHVSIMGFRLSKPVLDFPKTVWLIPKHPKYYGVSYYTLSPGHSIDNTWFQIDELQCDTFCYLDGKVVTTSDRYDGIQRLFDDEAC